MYGRADIAMCLEYVLQAAREPYGLLSGWVGGW